MKVAVLSDIHGNIDALNEVLLDLERHGCKKVFVLGDLVGYYYWPRQVISRLRDIDDCHIIKGNHEFILESMVGDEAYQKTIDRRYGSGHATCFDELDGEAFSWLKGLPASLEVKIDKRVVSLCHGSDESVDEYIYPDCSNGRVNDMSRGKDIVFYGHTHYPVVFIKSNAVIANPGSVGQPRDVGGVASYIIWDTENDSFVVRRIPFPIERIIVEARLRDPQKQYLVDILRRGNCHV